MKVEDIGEVNGQVKDGEQLVEINGHYMVKRTDDTWRKLFNMGDKRGLVVSRAFVFVVDHPSDGIGRKHKSKNVQWNLENNLKLL